MPSAAKTYGEMDVSADKKTSRQDKYFRAAEIYTSVGWAVYPVEFKKKKPALLGGVNGSVTFASTFRKMAESFDKFGIAIAAGNASEILIIDVDKRNGGEGSMNALTERLGDLPETPTVITGGGGRHYYFKLPAGKWKKCELESGIDILVNGFGAVAPPSMHPSGKRYEWAEGLGSVDSWDSQSW